MALDANVRTYDPKQVIITFGTKIITGFGEGTVVVVERNGQSFTKKKGIDGTVDRTNNNARDFQVTVTIKQTSRTNSDLSEIHASDQINNDGVKPLTIKDLSGTTFFNAPSAWIQSDPNIEFAAESGDVDWVFDTGVADKFSGGNNVA